MKTGKTANRDSIRKKVLGKRVEGVRGGERKALLQKGFLSPPPVLSPNLTSVPDVPDSP